MLGERKRKNHLLVESKEIELFFLTLTSRKLPSWGIEDFQSRIWTEKGNTTDSALGPRHFHITSSVIWGYKVYY